MDLDEMILQHRKEAALHRYWLGWRSGVRGGVLLDVEAKNADFAQGHADGRELRRCAYEAACDHYGSTLDPLRQ